VTLNLIRYAACCPDELRPVLETLAGFDWDMKALDRESVETIFAFVDDDLAANATSEYVADTQSITDWSRDPAVREGDFVPTCRLCGHHHIRWDFILKNVAGGRDHNTGSTCIIEYGLSVDGDGTAEEALERLKGAISKAKRKADREDWEAAHPDADAAIKTIANALIDAETKPAGWSMWSALKPNWKTRAKSFAKVARAVTKYYAKHGFLTAQRTTQVWGPDGTQTEDGIPTEGLIVKALAIADEWALAVAVIEGYRQHWRDFIAAHSLTRHEMWTLDYAVRWAQDPDDPSPRTKDAVNAILARARRAGSGGSGGTSPAAPPTKSPSDGLPF
tara:strand:- start:98 stop:1096 length:999 start_codon:yes stop_codon:yes gene_type:complete